MQEAFGSDAQHPFLPHNHVPACLAYSSTHDSDTALGWWATANASTRTRAREYLQCTDDQLHWALIRSTSQSVAQLALFPVQDVLGLDGSHRMNLPGTGQGNWSWRVQADMLQPLLADELARITAASGRAALGASPASPASPAPSLPSLPSLPSAPSAPGL